MGRFLPRGNGAWRIGRVSLAIAAASLSRAAESQVMPAPQAFRQEVAARFALPSSAAMSGLRALAVDAAGKVLVFDGENWFAPEGRGEFDGPAGRLVGWPAPAERGSDATAAELSGHDVRQVATTQDGQVLAATGDGLWRRKAGAAWEREEIVDRAGGIMSGVALRGVAVAEDGTWWVAFADRVARRRGGAWEFLSGREGVPVADFTCVAAGRGNEIWFGTRQGAVRFDGRDWAYREGPRWLPGNDVRAILTTADGRTWFATDKGLGCIESRPMTLAQKAEWYESEVERFIKRTPYGYTSEVGLGAPGERAKIAYSDSDNDGLWTAMYGAGECFAYAATRRPEFKRRATQAFEALRFLQKVTQGGPHRPPKGFVARSIRPVDWPDPNVGGLERDRLKQQEDKLWKVYAPRWPKSADGQWYWKSDTSSDELDGHFFFHAAYYDHVAETETEKERVREVVRDLVDHLIAHDYCLVDHDGTPTRWGVFGPKQLNHDPNWWVERGINSLSILSYLAVAEHLTGDARYAAAARELIDRHGYGANVMNPKTQTGVASGNQSDDEMAFMCFYNLLRYTRDATWRERWRFAFYTAWVLEQPEMNPLFNFLFAAHGLGRSYANAWGAVPVKPWDGWQDDALATLRGFPLDRVNWPQRNSHRLDLVPLRPQQTTDLASDDSYPRAGRADGKVLPVQERHFGHWNTDPWRLDYGGNGRQLASGAVYLLPYYLGLHLGYIARPE